MPDAAPIAATEAGDKQHIGDKTPLEGKGYKREGRGSPPATRVKAPPPAVIKSLTPTPLIPYKRGRPSTYQPEFCDFVIAKSAEGFSLGAIAGLIGIARQTLSEWQSEHPEFGDAVSRAKGLRLAVWEGMALDIGRRGGGGPGASAIVVFGLKNMGSEDWRDRSEVAHTGGVHLSFSKVDESL